MKQDLKSRLLSIFLSLTMVLSVLPSTAFAATTTTASDTTSTNVEKVQSYASQLRKANDAAKTTGGFSWDTESKSYSWAYFNGLMLDAFGMIGGDENTNYIDQFYSANINSDGTPANLSNGKASYGALDSVEPIRAIFDVLSTSQNKTKYQQGIQYIYSMLENQITYENAGYNYAHKQTNGSVDSSWSAYPVALDGLYMAEPFLMECANAIESGDLTLTTENILYADLSSSISTLSLDDASSYDVEDDASEEENSSYKEENDAASDTSDESQNYSVSEDGEESMTLQSVEEDSDVISYEEGSDSSEESLVIGSDDSKDVTSEEKTEESKDSAAVDASDDEAAAVSDNADDETDADISLASAEDNSIYTVDSKAIYDAVYERMAWVYDNMYDEKTGLYMHAYSPENEKTNGVAWSRSIGWYAMALVDIIDMMPNGDERDELISYLPRLFDGLLQYQDSDTGMWYNVPASGASLSKNELETSGTSMFAYAMMKAYNNGWVTDDKYGEAGLKAFNGVVANKMTGSEGNYSVSGTYLKSGVSTSASGYTTNDYTTNEAKGVGALIMASTLAEETADKLPASEDTTPAEIPESVTDKASGITVSDSQATGIYVEDIKTDPMSDYSYDDYTETTSEYPEYPNDGAVRIDKTASGYDFNSTGVANVELDVAGVSVKTGVDVVLVVDVSNSMAWSVENAGGDNDAARLPSSGQTTKLENAMDAASSFADILLGGNTGASSDNTLSFVTFAGFDAQHMSTSDSKYSEAVDSVMTVFSGVKDASKAKTSFSGTSCVGTASGTSSANYVLTVKDENGNTLVSGNNRGNTNYDYAFWQANQCVTALHNSYSDYDSTGRETVVVFMTDGAASHYNGNRSNGSRNDYLPGTTTVYPGITSYPGYSSSDVTGTWLTYMTNNDNTQAVNLYNKVDGFYAVGFDLAHGGFSTYQWTEEQLSGVLKSMVSTSTGKDIPVMTASDASTLKTFYESLANQFKLAGTNAQVTDYVNADYTLQTKSQVGIDSKKNVPSTITVTSYDLYTKTDTSDTSLIGTRKGTYEVLEEVTFNSDGTKAYSDILTPGTNIMTTASDGSVKIEAYYFTYTKNASGEEKFIWKIGDITDKELALSYYVYLKNALEGSATEGIHYTNKSAELDYVDMNNKKAEKIFPMPALVWGGASTAYEFYLVNVSGQPVNHAGEVVPFANRVIVYGPEYKTLNLNQGDTEAAKVNAKDVLPEGYYLYDEEAYYTVKSTSGDTVAGKLTVSDPSSDASATKGGQTQTGAQTTIVVSFDEENYTESRVAFGIRYDMTPTYVDEALANDKIVIDYGEPISVDVLANDPQTITSNKGATKYDGYTKTLVGFTTYNEKTNTKQVQTSAGSATYGLDEGSNYGAFKIENQKVIYTPSKMINSVERVFCVVELKADNDTFYLYEELDVIPATIMYYETNFTSSDITITYGTDMIEYGTSRLGNNQDDGTIGKNQTYGYDSTYNDDDQLSAESSYYIDNTSGDDKTVASFTFTGTGFDLISRTGANQGAIQAIIYSSADKTEDTIVKKINVLNKSESNLELYQIPVISATVDYGTYYVDIIARTSRNKITLTNLNRGGEFYFDALRVYNPVDPDDTTSKDATLAKDAYDSDGEADMTLTELRAQLIAGAAYSLDDDEEAGTSGVFYIDRTKEGAELATYAKIGPDNEVYLTSTTDEEGESSDETLAFEVDLSDGIPASYDIGAKSADGNSAVLHVSVYNADEDADEDDSLIGEIKETLSSSTVQYYGIFDDIYEDLEDVDSVIVVIDTYSDAGILSVTDLKSTGGVAPTPVASAAAKGIAFSALAPSVAESAEADYDVKSAEITSAKVVRNKNVTMSVVTGADVASLTVTNKAGKAQSITTDVTENADGTKTWTVTFKVSGTGTQVYTIAGFGQDGESGETVSVTAKVALK